MNGLQIAAALMVIAAGVSRVQTASADPNGNGSAQTGTAQTNTTPGGTNPGGTTLDSSVTRVQVVFSGGHATDPRDRGRPVILIASGLGVPPEVFREAFSHVHPAPAGTAPDPEEVRRNKEALLGALSQYGVTNERLDAVSNYYRYDRRLGLWRTTPATAYVLIRDGQITGFEITNGGSGYSSPPTVTVPGFPSINAIAQLRFTQSSRTNGSIAGIRVAPADTN